MNKREIQHMILPEEKYEETMDTVVKPYIESRKTESYCEREEGKRIFYIRCLADDPKGIIVISHGFTETIEKHLENIYYFLQLGYHVFMPEHCGHGRSYRICSDTNDLSLVHVDDYKRYVNDLLFVCHIAAEEFPELPIILYGHSMGGGTGARIIFQGDPFFPHDPSMQRPCAVAVCVPGGQNPLHSRKRRTICDRQPPLRWTGTICEQVRKLNRRKKGNAKLVPVPGLKHEIFNSGTKTLECYWWKMRL